MLMVAMELVSHYSDYDDGDQYDFDLADSVNWILLKSPLVERVLLREVIVCKAYLFVFLKNLVF